MIETLLGLASGLVALLLWWLRRRAARRDNPLEQHRQRYENIDREMVRTPHQRPGAGRGSLADDLDELDRLQKSQGDRRRPGNDQD